MGDSPQSDASYAYDEAGPTYDSRRLYDAVIGLCRQAGGRRVLDLGCGNGVFCQELVAQGFEAVGCDPSDSGIRVARQAVPGVTFHQLGVHEDPARLGVVPFDTAVAIEVVEHLYLPRQLPEFARRVLKPGGRLIVTTPYHGYWKNLAISLLGRWDAHWSSLWDGGHIKFWSVDTLRALVEPVGFEFDGFVGVGRLPGFWKSMALVFRATEARSPGGSAASR